MRRQIGMYLGVAPQSGEHFVGTWNGDVIRTRSIVRVVESLRWDTDFLLRLKGTPSRPIPSGVDRYGRVEECEDPHAMIEVAPEKHAQQKFDHEVHKRTRIMRADLDKYGYTDGSRAAKPLKLGTTPQTRIIRSGVEFESMVSGNKLVTLNGSDFQNSSKKFAQMKKSRHTMLTSRRSTSLT